MNLEQAIERTVRVDMSTNQMRTALSKLYGPSWVQKVENMSDKQVAAVYQRKLNEGAFNKEKK